MKVIKNYFLISILLIFSINLLHRQAKTQELTIAQIARMRAIIGKKKDLNDKLSRTIYYTDDNEELLKEIQKLLNEGADPTEKAYTGKMRVATALYWAINKNRSYEVIQALLKRKVYPKEKLYEALEEAIVNGNLPIIKLLKQYGTDLTRGYTLRTAASNGKFDIVDYLITEGANKTFKDSEGATYKEYALSWATKNNDLKRMREFLEIGADPNQYLNGTVLPLRYAFMQKNDDSIRLLIDYGADPYIQFNCWKSEKRLVIDVVDSDEQRKFVEDYYRIVLKTKLPDILPCMPKEIIEIIASY